MRLRDRHLPALKFAIEQGITLIDTSSHFGGGEAERTIGKALENFKRRDNLIITSKAGYVQTHHKDGIELQNGQFHCISESFIESEITASLARMGTSYIDTFLLNNPERLMLAKDGFEKARLYDLISKSIIYLEKEVSLGRIKSYGIASNSIHKKSSHQHIDLKMIMNLAPSKNLNVVQYPLNIFERDALYDGIDGSPSLIDTIKVIITLITGIRTRINDSATTVLHFKNGCTALIQPKS